MSRFYTFFIASMLICFKLGVFVFELNAFSMIYSHLKLEKYLTIRLVLGWI